MCVCVLVLIRSWISKFHRWNPLFYSISVFKMIRVASCNSWSCRLIMHSISSGHGSWGDQGAKRCTALQPCRWTWGNSHLAYDTAERVSWCVAGLTAGACHYLLRSFLPLPVYGVMYRATHRCCAAQRTAGCAWGSPLPPPRARSCQSITLMMHLHVSSLGAHLGWASLHCVRQASTMVWSLLDLGSVISKKPVSSPPKYKAQKKMNLILGGADCARGPDCLLDHTKMSFRWAH